MERRPCVSKVSMHWLYTTYVFITESDIEIKKNGIKENEREIFPLVYTFGHWLVFNPLGFARVPQRVHGFLKVVSSWRHTCYLQNHSLSQSVHTYIQHVITNHNF